MDNDLDLEELLYLIAHSGMFFHVFMSVHVRCSWAEGRDGTSGSNRTSRTSWNSRTTGRKGSVKANLKLVVPNWSKFIL